MARILGYLQIVCAQVNDIPKAVKYSYLKECFVVQLVQQYQECQLQMKVMMLWYKFYMKGLEIEKQYYMLSCNIHQQLQIRLNILMML